MKAGLLPPYGVLACSAVFFWSLSVRALIYTLMPTIAADLRLSSSLAGTALAGLLLGNSMGNWVAGWLPGSRKRRVMVAILVSLPVAVLMSAVHDFWALLVASAALGLSLGIYLPLGLSLVVEAGGADRKARYISVHETGATLASFSGSVFVALSLPWTDWRTSVLLWCGVGVISLVAFARVPDRDGSTSRWQGFHRLPLDRRLLYSCVSFVASTMLLAGLVSVLPLIMVRAWGVDPTHAASVVGYTRLGGLVGVAVAGVWADRRGHGTVLRALLLLGLAGCLAMSLDGYGPLFLAGMAATAAGAGGIVTVLPAVVAEAYPVGQRDRALGTSIGVGGLVGSVASPPLFGFLLDAGLPTGPLVVAAATTLLGIVATGRLATRRADGTGS